MATTGEDCKFFYESACRKGQDCRFRHVEAAKNARIDCKDWSSGDCSSANCKLRHPKKAMSGKGKKSDGRKGAAKEQSGPAMTPGPTTVITNVHCLTVIDHHPKPEVKGEKDEPGSDSTPQKSGQLKKKPESDKGALGGPDEDIKDEPGSDSTPQKSGQLKKKPESDKETVRGPDEDIKAKGTTSKKIIDMDSFVEESMKSKTITDVPGIGERSKLAKKLEEDGYTMAEHLLACFLSKDMKKVETDFKRFIDDHGGNKTSQKDVYTAMEEWTKKHL